MAPVPEHRGLPIVEELAPIPDPIECFERLAGLEYRILLDSAALSARAGRYSFLTADPAIVVRSKGTRTERIDRRLGLADLVPGDALGAVRSVMRPFSAAAVDGLPPFQGGVAGFVAYDWGRLLERLPAPRYDDIGLPDVVLGVYDWVLAVDHVASKSWLISTGLPETNPDARMRRAETRASDVWNRLRSQVDHRPSTGPAAQRRRQGETAAPSYPVDGGWRDLNLAVRSSFTRDGYLGAVNRVRDYIVAGDVFQVNLSQRFEVPLSEHPWSFFRRLRVRNAAPFSAYLELPDGAIVSASPERFLRVDAVGRVETRPIKGTRPRGMTAEHDAALGLALSESAKDRAENLMIVDLMRNDLSQVCAPGTVRVTELFALERYPTVHHLVSTIVGELAPGRDALDLLRASFPGGSITGAPKVRAMEIIAELEPSQRSVYCGAIGYWSATGALDVSIAIRTMIALRGRAYFGAGGGIVAESDPDQEYRETLDKARGIVEALAVVHDPAHR
jgi:para-aminobenzoate synthetase component 1